MTLRNPLPKLASVQRLTKLALAGEDHRQWYQFAHAQVVVGAALLDCEPRRFADLLALFSPRVSVLRSVRFAVHYVQTGEYLSDVMKSIRATVEHYEETGEIRGPKCQAFARAIMGDQSAIVLDTWMGEAIGVPSKRFEVKGVRTPCERLVLKTAERLGWTNAETQAAIWAGIVRESGRNVPQFFIESEIDGVPI